MSPKHVKTTSSRSAIARPSSTRPVGKTHTGQPGPWTSSMFSGKHVAQAVAVDRVGVAAANFHDAVVPRRVDRPGELARDARDDARIAKFIDVLHRAHRSDPRTSNPALPRSPTGPRPSRAACEADRCACSSSILLSAKPTWMRIQSPAPASPGVEQPDVDVALHAAHVDPRQQRLFGRDLDDLAGDCEAHALGRSGGDEV